MSRSAILLAAYLAGACSASAGSRSLERTEIRTTTTSVTLLPAGVDLTGSWATGTGPGPAVARVTLHPSCTYNPPAWIIRQTGNLLEAWAFPESYNQGIVVRGPGRARIAAARGTISGLDVAIDDGGTRYALRYDETSGQLRGTRSGEPFWAVRQEVVRTHACPGVP